jgi:translation initiation factor 4G
VITKAKSSPAVLKKAPLESPEVIQRNIQSLMNKISPENFQSISQKLEKTIMEGMEALADPGTFLKSVVEVIFEKAVREFRYAESYSQLCVFLSQNLPEKPPHPSFKKLLLNKCQLEFESPATTPTSPLLSDSEILLRLKDRHNGVPPFLGALFLHGILSEKIIHYCLRKLLTTQESDLLKFAGLMTLIGHSIDHPKAKVLMDTYFAKIEAFSQDKSLPVRVRFKLIDLIDLRKMGWQSKDAKKVQLPPPPPPVKL